MLSSFLDILLKVSKTTSSQKLFAYDCVTLYVDREKGLLVDQIGQPFCE